MQGKSQVILALAAAFAPLAAAAPYHEDGRAGIRFPIPFAKFEEKSGAQVTALVLADPRVKIPPGIELTSGVYDASGSPFIVVWKKDERQPPTQKQLVDLAGATPLLRRFLPWAKGLPEDLSFDAGLLRGTGSLKATAPLKGRATMQITKEGEVFVGLFYKEAYEAALLDRASEGLAVLPGHGLRYADLAPGGLSLRGMIAWTGALLTCGSAAALVTLRRRRAAPGRS